MAARMMDREQLEAVIWRTLTRYDPRPLFEDVHRILTAAAAYSAWEVRDITAERRAELDRALSRPHRKQAATR